MFYFHREKQISRVFIPRILRYDEAENHFFLLLWTELSWDKFDNVGVFFRRNQTKKERITYNLRSGKGKHHFSLINFAMFFVSGTKHHQRPKQTSKYWIKELDFRNLPNVTCYHHHQHHFAKHFNLVGPY